MGCVHSLKVSPTKTKKIEFWRAENIEIALLKTVLEIFNLCLAEINKLVFELFHINNPVIIILKAGCSKLSIKSGNQTQNLQDKVKCKYAIKCNINSAERMYQWKKKG